MARTRVTICETTWYSEDGIIFAAEIDGQLVVTRNPRAATPRPMLTDDADGSEDGSEEAENKQQKQVNRRVTRVTRVTPGRTTRKQAKLASTLKHR